jgi:hypothetical protein
MTNCTLAMVDINNPTLQPTDLLLKNNQAAINGIRLVGAQQLILAPGNGFTGGHAWNQTTGSGDAPSSDFLNKLVDPLHNTAIDVHEVCFPLIYHQVAFHNDVNMFSVPRYVRTGKYSVPDVNQAVYVPDIDFSGGHDECTQPGA